jgi:anti-sigma regulatory factor (Ser/Thr protein kinase)
MRDRFSRGRSTDEPDGPHLSLGCGLGAVGRLMSTVHFDRQPGGGTVVRATKRREPVLSWW